MHCVHTVNGDWLFPVCAKFFSCLGNGGVLEKGGRHKIVWKELSDRIMLNAPKVADSKL